MKRYKRAAVWILLCAMFIIVSMTDANAKTMQNKEMGNIICDLENGVLTISGKGAIPECKHKKIKWSEAKAHTECEYDGSSDWTWYDNWYMEEVKSVVIEEGITSIPAHAFAHSFPNAQTLIIPSTVKSIGHAAFEWCGFRQVIMGDGVTSLGVAAFNDCYYLESVKLSKNIKKIEERTFAGCTSLKQISIPQKVEMIGESAFKSCWELKTVNWEGKSRLKEIESHAFDGCIIKKLTMPASVKKIGEFAIGDVRKIQVEKKNKKYKSKNGVLFSKDGKTLICYPVKKKGSTYKIPKGVKTIGKNAFSGCLGPEENPYLKKLIMPDSVTVIKEEAFLGVKKLKTVRFSKSLKKIERNAFMRCPLTSLKLPSSLMYLEAGAFDCHKMKGTITVPKNVKEMGWGAFDNAHKIKKIVVKSKKLKKVSKIVGNTNKVKIVLPKSKQEAYKKFFTKKTQGKNATFVYK